MPNLTRLERLVDTTISRWSQEETRPSQIKNLLTDLDQCTQEDPSAKQRISFSNGPLTILSLEESDRIWFKLGEMSLNLWLGKETSPVEHRSLLPIPYVKSLGYIMDLGNQTSSMYYLLGQHTVRVDSSFVFEAHGMVRFSSMSEVFVDGVLAGTAVGSAVKGGVAGTGGVHSHSPAYVLVGRVVLAVYGPRPDLHRPHWKPWSLLPPRVVVWLETSEAELDAIGGTHQYEYGSFSAESPEITRRIMNIRQAMGQSHLTAADAVNLLGIPEKDVRRKLNIRVDAPHADVIFADVRTL